MSSLSSSRLPFFSSGAAWQVAMRNDPTTTPTKRTQPGEEESLPKRSATSYPKAWALASARPLLVQLVLHVLGDVRDGALVLVPDRLPDAAVGLGRAHFLALLGDQRLRLAAQRLALGRLGVDLLLLHLLDLRRGIPQLVVVDLGGVRDLLQVLDAADVVLLARDPLRLEDDSVHRRRLRSDATPGEACEDQAEAESVAHGVLPSLAEASGRALLKAESGCVMSFLPCPRRPQWIGWSVAELRVETGNPATTSLRVFFL